MNVNHGFSDLSVQGPEIGLEQDTASGIRLRRDGCAGHAACWGCGDCGDWVRSLLQVYFLGSACAEFIQPGEQSGVTQSGDGT